MNFTTVHYLNIFLGAGAIALQIFSVVALFLVFFNAGRKNKFLDFIDKRFLTIGFLVSLVSALFSLVYSEVVNFLPCQLCWYQRIFLYPQVFLFGVALWDKDRKIIRYSLPLLAAGFLVSIYQNMVYYFGNPSGACDASGVSCFDHLVSEFGGYISIPMLALTGFFSMLVLTLVVHFYRKGQ